jgi:hypothetical protein
MASTKSTEKSSKIKKTVIKAAKKTKKHWYNFILKGTVIFFLGIIGTIIAYLIFIYVIYQVDVNRETREYSTLTKALETIKPELETVSPEGSVWTLEKYCSRSPQSVGSSLDGCAVNLRSNAKMSSLDSAIELARKYDNVVSKHPELFVGRGSFRIDDLPDYGSPRKKEGYSVFTVKDVSFTGCGGYIQLMT